METLRMNDALWLALDRAIKETWTQSVEKDYTDAYILNEDTLKNVFYHHLRVRMEQNGDLGFLRIYTECTGFGFNQIYQKKHLRPDMVVANGEQIVAVVEFKYKNMHCYDLEGEILRDYEKMRIYLRKGRCLDEKCQFYVATITPGEFSRPAWLDKRQTNYWAKGRVTELNAYMPDGEMKFDIISYNGMNLELNTV
ncbi:MAG: hypothetical protein IJO37_10525 [Ruminiclostridium sp.]|nr:hypothetical protein [Ruminiclostridium sp.]